MKKIFAIAVALAGTLALPPAVFASTFGCNGCTPAQMYDVAWSELYSPGVQPGYVVNLVNGTVAKYANIANIPDPYDPEPPPYEPNIIEVPVEPAIASLIHDLYVMTNGNTLAVHAPATPASAAVASKSSAQPASGDRLPVNAYEAMMDPDLAQRVEEMVRRDMQHIEAHISFFAADNAHVLRHFDVDDLPMEATFYYRDGSTAKYHFIWHLQKWQRVAQTSRDGRYNPIPEGKQDISRGGNYDFEVDTGPAEDINWFRWLVESFGVPVIDMRPNIGGGGGIVCVDNVCYIQIF